MFFFLGMKYCQFIILFSELWNSASIKYYSINFDTPFQIKKENNFPLFVQVSDSGEK